MMVQINCQECRGARNFGYTIENFQYELTSFENQISKLNQSSNTVRNEQNYRWFRNVRIFRSCRNFRSFQTFQKFRSCFFRRPSCCCCPHPRHCLPSSTYPEIVDCKLYYMQKKMFTVDQNKTILVAIILMDLNENNIMLKVKNVILL